MNKTNVDLSEIDTVILAGGLGTRLQPVLKDKPKCLARINGKPFIDILLNNCIEQGLQRFILCVGYLKEQVINHLRNRDDCEIVFSEENEPLGTGGALKNAKSFIKSDPFLVMNGDTYNCLDYKDIFKYHLEKLAFATFIISGIKPNENYGQVIINTKTNRVTNFIEKSEIKKNGYASAGVYLLNKKLFCVEIDKNCFSLETDIFPLIIRENCFAYRQKYHHQDIGTPERYNIAQKILNVHNP